MNIFRLLGRSISFVAAVWLLSASHVAPRASAALLRLALGGAAAVVFVALVSPPSGGRGGKFDFLKNP